MIPRAECGLDPAGIGARAPQAFQPSWPASQAASQSRGRDRASGRRKRGRRRIVTRVGGGERNRTRPVGAVEELRRDQLAKPGGDGEPGRVAGIRLDRRTCRARAGAASSVAAWVGQVEDQGRPAWHVARGSRKRGSTGAGSLVHQEDERANPPPGGDAGSPPAGGRHGLRARRLRTIRSRSRPAASPGRRQVAEPRRPRPDTFAPVRIPSVARARSPGSVNRATTIVELPDDPTSALASLGLDDEVSQGARLRVTLGWHPSSGLPTRSAAGPQSFGQFRPRHGSRARRGGCPGRRGRRRWLCGHCGVTGRTSCVRMTDRVGSSGRDGLHRFADISSGSDVE